MESSQLAAAYMDVVCSIGPGIGKAADPVKLVKLREALGEQGSLALASDTNRGQLKVSFMLVTLLISWFGSARIYDR